MHITQRDKPESEQPPFELLVKVVERSGVPFKLHEHIATRTMADAQQNVAFDIERIVKTVVFRLRTGDVVLAALRGTARVDYPRFAALAGVNRRDLTPLSPGEVKEFLGVEPGSVSPIPSQGQITVFIDDDVMTIEPSVYCGIGRPDRTLEISASDLAKVSGCRSGAFSR